jgi:hypothetical protein
MAASQVVLYFERQEDALRFTLAASTVLSAGESLHRDDAAEKVAQEICKASRITAGEVVSLANPS